MILTENEVRWSRKVLPDFHKFSFFKLYPQNHVARSLNRKIHKHLSAYNLLSDRQYGFRKGRYSGDLASLSNSWSSFLSSFGETFAVALDMSNSFDRVWHKSFLFKLPSYGCYPSLCTLIYRFLSDRSISAVVDGQCSTPITKISGVSLGSVL